MNIRAKSIKIIFDNSSEDNWEATCGGGIEFDDAMRMIARAWREYDEPKKPIEPLIKDERTRKVIRAWAEVNSVEEVLYAERPNKTLCCFTDMGKDDFAIEFAGSISSLKDGEVYSIDELCGEEEE